MQFIVVWSLGLLILFRHCSGDASDVIAESIILIEKCWHSKFEDQETLQENIEPLNSCDTHLSDLKKAILRLKNEHREHILNLTSTFATPYRSSEELRRECENTKNENSERFKAESDRQLKQIMELRRHLNSSQIEVEIISAQYKSAEKGWKSCLSKQELVGETSVRYHRIPKWFHYYLSTKFKQKFCNGMEKFVQDNSKFIEYFCHTTAAILKNAKECVQWILQNVQHIYGRASDFLLNTTIPIVLFYYPIAVEGLGKVFGALFEVCRPVLDPIIAQFLAFVDFNYKQIQPTLTETVLPWTSANILPVIDLVDVNLKQLIEWNKEFKRGVTKQEVEIYIYWLISLMVSILATMVYQDYMTRGDASVSPMSPPEGDDIAPSPLADVSDQELLKELSRRLKQRTHSSSSLSTTQRIDSTDSHPSLAESSASAIGLLSRDNPQSPSAADPHLLPCNSSTGSSHPEAACFTDLPTFLFEASPPRAPKPLRTGEGSLHATPVVRRKSTSSVQHRSGGSPPQSPVITSTDSSSDTRQHDDKTSIPARFPDSPPFGVKGDPSAFLCTTRSTEAWNDIRCPSTVCVRGVRWMTSLHCPLAMTDVTAPVKKSGLLQ